jgi:hypothetical protein
MQRGLPFVIVSCLVAFLGCGSSDDRAAASGGGGSANSGGKSGSGGAGGGKAGSSSGGTTASGGSTATGGSAGTGGGAGAGECTTAGPTIQSATGSWDHKAVVNLSGCGFGSKPMAAPLVWDDASGQSPSEKWDWVYPYTNDPAFRLAYRAPSEVTKANGVKGGVPLPHSHIQKYLAGAHYNSTSLDAHAGWDVCAGKNGQQGQTYTYISYYRTIDPSWYTVSPDPASNDHNFKEYDYAQGDGYMGDGPNIYLGDGAGENPLATSLVWGGNYTEGMGVTIHSVNTAFMNWYPEYDTVFSSVGAAGVGQGWQKVELILKHDSDDGFHRVFQDNQLVWDISLDDDGLSPGSRSETVIGGYSREASNGEQYKNNWRYYADVYYDHSLARVVLADNQNYEQAKIVEPQIPSSWSESAITISVNLGRLPAGKTAYLFVVDASGARSASGFPVSL